VKIGHGNGMAQRTSRDEWNEWSHYVLEAIKRSEARLDTNSKRFTEIEKEIARLSVKSGVWGAIGALIPILIGLIFWLLSK